MKNVYLCLIFMLVFFPRISFAISPALEAFNQQQDAESKNFFNQQAQERGAFIKANQALIDKQDRHAKWVMAHKNGQNSSTINSSWSAADKLTDQEQSTFSTFVAKQQGDKIAFFQKMNQERQAFLSANPGIN